MAEVDLKNYTVIVEHGDSVTRLNVGDAGGKIAMKAMRDAKGVVELSHFPGGLDEELETLVRADRIVAVLEDPQQ